MSLESRVRELQAQTEEARRIQKEALEDWRKLTDFGKHASALFTVSVRLAVATHNYESLADELEWAQADWQREVIEDREGVA